MGNHYLYVNERDWRMIDITKDYTNKGVWEPETTKIVQAEVRPGQTALDIGASIGYFSLLLAEQVGKNGRVISFEPTDGNFKYLKHNIKKNKYKNIEPHQLAAWNKSEQVQVMQHSFTHCVRQGIAIDDFLERHNIYPIDFIKLDIDGADLKALQGLERTIQRNKHLKMVCEYYPKYLQKLGEVPDDFLNFVEKYFDITVLNDYDTDHWNFYCVRKQE